MHRRAGQGLDEWRDIDAVAPTNAALEGPWRGVQAAVEVAVRAALGFSAAQAAAEAALWQISFSVRAWLWGTDSSRPVLALPQ